MRVVTAIRWQVFCGFSVLQKKASFRRPDLASLVSFESTRKSFLTSQTPSKTSDLHVLPYSLLASFSCSKEKYVFFSTCIGNIGSTTKWSKKELSVWKNDAYFIVILQKNMQILLCEEIIVFELPLFTEEIY